MARAHASLGSLHAARGDFEDARQHFAYSVKVGRASHGLIMIMMRWMMRMMLMTTLMCVDHTVFCSHVHALVDPPSQALARLCAWLHEAETSPHGSCRWQAWHFLGPFTMLIVAAASAAHDLMGLLPL